MGWSKILETSASGAGASPAITWTAPKAGNLLFVASAGDGSVSALGNLTGANGWTRYTAISNCEVNVWWKIATGTETGSGTLTQSAIGGSGWAMYYAEWSGNVASSTVDVSVTLNDSGVAANPVQGAVLTTGAGTQDLVLAILGDNGSPPSTFVATNGFVDDIAGIGLAGNRGILSVAHNTPLPAAAATTFTPRWNNVALPAHDSAITVAFKASPAGALTRYGVTAAPSMRPWRFDGPNPDGWYNPLAMGASTVGKLNCAADMGLLAGMVTDPSKVTLRFEIPWRLVEKTVQGTYDWSHLDNIANVAMSYGINLHAIVVFTPSWSGAYNANPTTAQLNSFLTAAVARYKAWGTFGGKQYGIRIWEIWNEPNDASNHYYTGTAAQYSTLLDSAYGTIKAADSNALVIAAGVALNWAAWISGMTGGTRFDYMAFHSYPGSAAQVNTDYGTARTQFETSFPGKPPLIIDEFGVQGAGDNSSWMNTVFPNGAQAVLPASSKIYEIRDDFVPDAGLTAVDPQTTLTAGPLATGSPTASLTVGGIANGLANGTWMSLVWLPGDGTIKFQAFQLTAIYASGATTMTVNFTANFAFPVGSQVMAMPDSTRAPQLYGLMDRAGAAKGASRTTFKIYADPPWTLLQAPTPVITASAANLTTALTQVTTGDLIVVVAKTDATGTISDNLAGSGAWTEPAGSPWATNKHVYWKVATATGPMTITVANGGAAGSIRVSARQYKPPGSTVTQDTAITTVTNAGAVASPVSIGPSAALLGNDLVVAGVLGSGTNVVSQGAAAPNNNIAVLTNANGTVATEDALAWIAGTATATFAYAGTNQLDGVIIAFKSPLVLTKTQPAVARIRATVTKTQGATARIQITATKTQPAISRVQALVTKTQTALARIQSIVTKTQPALARIQVTSTKTQPGISRIQATVTKTQTAIAKISAAGAGTFTKTQTAVARIQATVTKTQSAIARISITGTKTQPATARIQITGSKTQTALARILATATKTQTALARISVVGTKTQPAIARIQITSTKTQPALARVQATRTATQTAVARIGTLAQNQPLMPTIVLAHKSQDIVISIRTVEVR